jgi:hypothetical protein
LSQNLGNRVINKGLWFFDRDYVIFAHGVCILSISVAGRLSGNNRPVDTPPISLNTTFDHISMLCFTTANGFTLLSTTAIRMTSRERLGYQKRLKGGTFLFDHIIVPDAQYKAALIACRRSPFRLTLPIPTTIVRPLLNKNRML